MKKKYLIIGASSGIGASLAHLLSEAGHRVYGTYCTQAKESKQANLSYHFLDVLQEDWAVDFLPDHLDGMAYCPGSIQLKPFHRIKVADFMQDFQLQTLGAIKAVQQILPALKKSEAASLLFFSTVAVKMGFNFHTQVAVSKGALEGLTKSLAAELAPKIRVNCIAPSLTDTPLAAKLLSTDAKKEANAERHPLKKIGQAVDVAEMAAFLLSNKAAWISGQIIAVDGGMSSLRT